jgi:hypothetical protein
MTTLVTEKVDILHHAQASLEGKPLALKRSIQASDGLRSYFAKITDLMPSYPGTKTITSSPRTWLKMPWN